MRVCVVLLCSLLIACGQTSTSTSTQSQVGDSTTNNAEQELASINQRLTRLEIQSFRANLLRSADLDLEDSKYSQLQTDFGTVLVSVRKVEAHLDGVQVTLRIGNPLDVTFHGFKIKTQWGERPPSGDDVAATDRWQAQLQSKEITLTDDLYPGSWTDVVVALSPATTEHFGYLNVEAPQFDELRLRMSP